MVREGDAVTSNGMNDEYTTNIPSCSDSDNNKRSNGEDGNGNLNQISQVWGTWEELLLTCAVKRHGCKDWDSVAKEVVSRTSLNASAPSCKLKYQDLKRRFQGSVVDDDDGRGNNETVAAAAAEEEEDIDGEIPWLEQLRSLRVAELRRDVQRCDESILSLQLKVKKLEEEKDDKPDLEDDSKTVRSLPSMNESNSTASGDHERLSGDKTVHTNENSRIPDPDHKAAAAVVEEEEGTVSRRSGMSHSGELGESRTSTVNRKRKGDNIKPDGNQSQPLIEIVKLIRSHPRGSVFESRLKSQETKAYKTLIRQHMDIKTIEKKMEKGSYVSSSLSFYRDLKLLFTNAIVFFPTSSSESMAAHELRTLVSNEMKKTTGISSHRVIKSEGGSSVSKQKSSAPPLVACKKKSSVSEKTLPSSSSFKQKDEKKVSEEKEVTTTATRSSRRTSKCMEVVAKDTKMGRAKNNNKKQTDSSNDDKEETPIIEKKRASEKKKSVAEFLKRIKNNSPQKGKETTSKDQKKSDGNVKNSKAKPRELRSNSTGKKKVEAENNGNKSSSKRKQSKKEAEEVTAVATTRKRGRESGKDNQQPKKRSRG
ncbi:hypothetical protein N665_1372s0002 [Sinapis alba]|nr:hypothetical protein N665_1372s0002 [Sinapis alba]